MNYKLWLVTIALIFISKGTVADAGGSNALHDRQVIYTLSEFQQITETLAESETVLPPSAQRLSFHVKMVVIESLVLTKNAINLAIDVVSETL